MLKQKISSTWYEYCLWIILTEEKLNRNNKKTFENSLHWYLLVWSVFEGPQKWYLFRLYCSSFDVTSWFHGFRCVLGRSNFFRQNSLTPQGYLGLQVTARQFWEYLEPFLLCSFYHKGPSMAAFWIFGAPTAWLRNASIVLKIDAYLPFPQILL